ncbi:hypothetical protein AB5L52_12240 [Streptomyces sp. CG4]|uniref:hypothetical protein n=1 Tax=Streptomyces sp. CG4 TaxID=408783 RepID=UPI0034E27D65
MSDWRHVMRTPDGPPTTAGPAPTTAGSAPTDGGSAPTDRARCAADPAADSAWFADSPAADLASFADDPAADLAWFADDPAAAETWAYGYPAPGADERAARAWAATAHAAAKSVGEAAVQVVGQGALARLIRLALPGPAPGSDPQPEVVVETTGSAAGIRGALDAVAPGGRVLLAARPLSSTTPLPTYHAVHRPGIRVLPIPWCDGVGDVPEHLMACSLRCIPWMSHGHGGT